MKSLRVFGFLVLLAGLGFSTVLAAGIKDSEAASHDDAASRYDLVMTYQGDGYKVLQFNLAVLSHYSYLLISGKEALLVDPGRDIDAYAETLKKEGVVCKGVFLTHSHADFVAGHTEAAKLFTCPVHASARGGQEYPHQSLTDGSTLEVGDVQVKFLETPGHTPDGICGVVAPRARPDQPGMMFSGDTLFLGSVGRPDLMGGTMAASTLAGMLFDTWNGKLSKLPDEVQVLPAHGAGSLCGAHLSDEPSSTIGAERRTNAYLQHAGNRGAFIAAILDGLPEAPGYFKHNAQMNRQGPPLVDWQAEPTAVTEVTAELTDIAKHYVVDLRSAAAYAAGHIPHSVNIALRGRLETWVGIMVPWGFPLVVTGDPAECREAVQRLHRVGFTAQVLPWEKWVAAGLPQNRNVMIAAAELHARLQKGEAPVIVDVRLPAEWMAMRIGTVLNLPLNHLADLAPSKIERDEPIVAVCNSAYRSSMAVGILERIGFTKASSLDGGSEAWIEAGFPTLAAAAASVPGAPPATPALRDLPLPERISAADLGRQAQDLPGTFELVDIRPAGQVADYNPLDARAVDIGDLLTNPVFLAGTVPLVIVDRDGSVAMAVGGILCQKTKRPIKVLYGGMNAYWHERGARPGTPAGSVPSPAGGQAAPASGAGTDAPGVAPVAPGSSPAPGPVAPAAPATPTGSPKKKKSAGC